jgi:hypothetical protein
MKKLNKTLSFAAFVCLLSFTGLRANAQFTVGARAGVNLATEPTAEYYHVFLALPHAGLFAQYQLPASFDLQLGANYSGEGVNLKDESTGNTYHGREGYLNVPLMVQYRFGFGGYVELGPQIGFLLSASEKDNGDPSVDTKQYYTGTEFSGGLGFGYEFNHAAPKGFGISVRYMRGISDIVKDNEGGEKVTSRVLSIGLTYRLSTAVKK